ncbi:MAG: HlyC/CorC family transporter [Gorillibacterium sp.]|nr:HlyC/CorC family transporter [Gorillibacterium sp.]
MGLPVSLILFFLLIAATAFFVATEFAVVKLRPSRANQLVQEGRRNALAVQHVVNHLDGYLSACQLGITITALGLGWLGEPTVEKILEPLFQSFQITHTVGSLLSFAIAFVIVTFLHVVVGELAPKTFAIRKTEQICFLFCPVIILFNKVMHPFIWLLNGSANGIVRLFGVQPASENEEAHSEEELRIILSESFKSGMINQEEFRYVDRIFNFDNLLAREIMIPRTDMVCLYTTRTLQENLAVIKGEKYTRFPVVTDSKDNVIGMINTKQFFLEYDDNPELDFTSIIHSILTVSETIPVQIAHDVLIRADQEDT